MTISNPAFPPVSEPISGLVDLVRSIDRERALQNLKRAGAVGTDCLLWTAALTVVAFQQGRKLLPHLATWLRAFADFIDPDSAPLTPPLTSRDITTLEFFQTRDRMARPTPAVPSSDELAVDADLQDMNHKQLMAEYGTKSRRLSKEQLIHKIMERRVTSLEEGA
jgi:hypothetical protein